MNTSGVNGAGAQAPSQKPAHVLEIAKKLQVLAENFAVKRAVEVFTVHWSHRRCESVVVKELLAPRKTLQHIGRQSLRSRVGSAFGKIADVRRRSQRAAIKLWLVNKISDTPGKVARPIIKTTKTGKVSVGGNVAVAAVDGVAIVPLGVNNNVGLVVTDAAEHVS